MGRNRKPNRGVAAVTTPLSTPFNQLRKRNPVRAIVQAGVPIAVHHVTTTQNAEGILRSGRFIPRNHPSNVFLFGNNQGGYFSFEGDKDSVEFYTDMNRGRSRAAILSATVTPQKPIRITLNERATQLGHDMRLGTRMEFVAQIRSQLPAAEQTFLDAQLQSVKQALARFDVEYEQYRFRRSRLPAYIDQQQFSELFNEATHLSTRYITTAMAAIKKLGYDAVAVIQDPNDTPPGSDIVGGSQLIVLDPAIVQLHGQRPWA